MASAARKQQPKAKRKGLTGSRGATKSRTPRATGVRRAKPARAGKKRAAAASTKKRVVRATKPVRKPVRRKAAASRLVKPLARKVAKKKPAAAAKPLVRKPSAKSAAKRVAKPMTRPAPSPRASSKPAPRRASAPVPPAFAVQRAGADARGLLLFELARGRAAVKAAIQGLTGANALLPTAPGKWSIFEIVLHLSERDRVRLDEFDRTLAGEPRMWAGMHDPEMGPVNESHLAPLRAHTWDEAVRRMDSLREELLARLDALPAEPDTIWKPGHAFGDMMWGLPEHDRHHAMQIKNARIGGDAPLEA